MVAADATVQTLSLRPPSLAPSEGVRVRVRPPANGGTEPQRRLEEKTTEGPIVIHSGERSASPGKGCLHKCPGCADEGDVESDHGDTSATPPTSTMTASPASSCTPTCSPSVRRR